MTWRHDRLLLDFEYGRLDCCIFAEDGGGSRCLKSDVVLAPDLLLKKFGVFLRPMFLIRIDPVL
jgi:hypothetical protein